MAATVEEGYVGNITAEHEKKLQHFWMLILLACDAETANVPDPLDSSSASIKSPGRRFSLLSRTESNTSASAGNKDDFKARINNSLTTMGSSKKEVTKIMTDLSQMPPEDFRHALHTMLKQDHPDALALRFLRARKWDVPKAFEMFVLAITWRYKEQGVDEKVLPYGESYEAERCISDSTDDQKKGNDFMSQFRMGKAFIHGKDIVGRPICVVRVKLHKPGAQTEEQLEKYIVHVIETARVCLVAPVESAAIVFDMTDFSISNFEYPPVKFIIRCFQDNYPESLGVMLIHNAPWIFSTFWRVIRGWLDPVVAAKVHFTKGVGDLEKFIPKENIIKELGGPLEYTYEYVEPIPGEDERLNDKITKDELMSERYNLSRELLRATGAWIGANGDNVDQKEEAAAKRNELIEALRVNYWQTDPYVRSRTHLDRTGVISAGGNIDFYPKQAEKKTEAAAPAVGEAATEKETADSENTVVALEETPAAIETKEKIAEIEHVENNTNGATAVAA